MKSHLFAVAAVLLILGGCGGAASDGRADAEDRADAPTATLTVGQSGTTAPQTVWYVRVETTKAKSVAEKGVPGEEISLTVPLEPGTYRVISWWRKCQSVCPTSGEQGLGPLEQVCGAPVTVTERQKVSVTVTFEADNCSVKVA
ncbi:MAG: hypothetical protein ACRDT4_04185 [Micromonosporaceae bacterium]